MQQINGFHLMFGSTDKPKKSKHPDPNSTDNVVRATENFRKYVGSKIEEDSKSREKAQREIKEANK